MVVYNRWFIIPKEQIDTDEYRPKYVDNPDIEGWSGTKIPASDISQHYAGLTDQFPDVDEWYVIRIYGEDNPGSLALDTIHNNQDTRTLADRAADVAPVLNENLPNHTGQEWGKSFKIA